MQRLSFRKALRRMMRLPCLKANVVCTTGAGDASMAAIVRAGVTGLSLYDTAMLSMKAGALTTECVEANHPNLKDILND